MTGRLLTARELSEQLSVSTGALLRWTRAGLVPAVTLPSGAIRYRPDEIDAWLDAHATQALLTDTRADDTVQAYTTALHGQRRSDGSDGNSRRRHRPDRHGAQSEGT